ncbi:hypothetical protein ACEWY4_016548 [Coilia grayii]|uniref:Transcription factor RFX3 n=1 Tax=Coilia grayii TaxID=363190 RepID=A0ABD1JN22_9TELE
MNGKACNLMVSPSNVPHALGALSGQHVPPSRVQSRPSCSSTLRLPTAAGPAGGVQPQTLGGSVLFPSLSLRRQVLTHGKGQDILGLPQSSWKQASSLSLPPATSNFTSKLGARVNCLESGGKGYTPHGNNNKRPTNINLQVTNNSMVVQSLGLPAYQSDSCPGPSVLSHSVGLLVPFTDTRSLLSRESLASTTLSIPDTQSIRSGRQDWQYGYRVLPPLGSQACSNPIGEEGPETLALPPGTAMSGATSISNPASLPAYLFAGGDAGSPHLPGRCKKRALSVSPLSDSIGIDLNSIIRTSPTSLVAYINGSRNSPASPQQQQQAQAEVCGHFLGVRGSCIPPSPRISTSLALAVTTDTHPNSECARMERLEQTCSLEGQLANMVVGQQQLPIESVSTQREVDGQGGTFLHQSLQLQLELAAVISAPTPPRHPPPPYHSHKHLPVLGHSQKLEPPLVLPGEDSVSPGSLPKAQCSILEDEDGELEDSSGGYCCRWIDCSALYSQREELVKHIEKLHVDQCKGEDFTCYWLGCPRRQKPFNARYKLLIHMRVHSGEKPNKCTASIWGRVELRVEELCLEGRGGVWCLENGCAASLETAWHSFAVLASACRGCGRLPGLSAPGGLMAQSRVLDLCLWLFSHACLSSGQWDRGWEGEEVLVFQALLNNVSSEKKPYACQVQGCLKRYTDPSSLRKHVKSHSTKDQQARKKLRQSTDLGQDGLSECLTIQPLQACLSPMDMIDSRLCQSPDPPKDLYLGVFSSNQSSSKAPAQLPRPAQSSPRLPVLSPMSDACRFVAPSPHELTASHLLSAPHPPCGPGALQRTCRTQSHLAPPDTHLQGFSGHVHMACAPTYDDSPQTAGPTLACSTMQAPAFEGVLSAPTASQSDLDLVHRALSGITEDGGGGWKKEEEEEEEVELHLITTTPVVLRPAWCSSQRRVLCHEPPPPHVPHTGKIERTGAMQTPEAGADSTTVPLQTSVQPAVSAQQGVSQTVPQVQHVYPAQVQYVEENNGVYTNGTIRTYTYSEPQLYSQNSGGNYFDTQGGSSQVTTVVSSHGMANNGAGGGGGGGTGAGGMGMGLAGGQIISSSGAYLIGGGGNSMDSAAPHPTTQTPRASPATIEMAIETLQKSEGLSSQRSSLLNSHLQWLLDNYETAEGVSLPRSTLYNHYLRHCQEQKLDPVNAASFGKLIRSIFMGLRTRRLGTRGNSKYHYYGIRVKPDSPLNRLQEDMQYKPVQKVDGMSGENYSGAGGQHAASAAEQTVIAQSQHHQQFLDASRALPEFAELELGESGVDHITADDVKALQTLYREHCEAILDVVVNLQFSLIEKLWQTFWRYSHSSTVEGATITENSGLSEIESRLPRAKLLLLCRNEGVLKWMSACDHLMYQVLVEILIPDVLRPIPSALTQAIRNFAKSLEGWLTTAMNAVPQRMLQTKVSAVSAFAQTLRRYTSLNHLAQAARAVLQNTSQINQMLSDLNRVDFANVQEQASWVCQCEEGVVQRLEQDFKATLQQQSSLEQWAAWLDNVVSQVLKPYEDRASFPKAARQFLLKWSFYSSMVIRDLTLRSAASFGSFHLIRLLYDEYMFYLVEHRVAQATGETPIGVMGECDQLNALSPNMDKDEVSEMDSDLDEELEESGEPLAKREKAEVEAEAEAVGCEPEIIQVLQVGTMEDGSSAVVGMLSALPSAGGTATIIPAEHVATAVASEHHILPPGATSTIRHCNSAGSSFAPV